MVIINRLTPSPDVFVVGGGPAGLAASIAIKQKGLSVTLADCALPPIDKACGEGLMPDSLAALAALGVFIPQDDAATIRGIRFIEKDRSVIGDFPLGPGSAVRRMTLHSHLAGRAAELGVKMMWGVKRIDFDGAQPIVNGQKVISHFIVGADGQNSLLRDRAGLGSAWYESKRFGFRQRFRVRPWSDYVEIYWGNAKQVFVAPTSGGEVSLSLIADHPGVRLSDALREFDALRKRVASSEEASREHGALTVFRRLKRVTRANIALIGDASGSVDSITGEGMCLAFRQSTALADCLAMDSLDNYQRLHTAISRRARLMTRLTLVLAHYPGIRRRVLRAFSDQPELLQKFLAIHVGEKPFRSLRSGDFVRLGLPIVSLRDPRLKPREGLLGSSVSTKEFADNTHLY